MPCGVGTTRRSATLIEHKRTLCRAPPRFRGLQWVRPMRIPRTWPLLILGCGDNAILGLADATQADAPPQVALPDAVPTDAVLADAVPADAAGPLPDLIPMAGYMSGTIQVTQEFFPLGHCAVQECLTGSGLRTLIRFATSAANLGDAHLVLGQPEAGSPLWEWDSATSTGTT